MSKDKNIYLSRHKKMLQENGRCRTPKLKPESFSVFSNESLTHQTPELPYPSLSTPMSIFWRQKNKTYKQTKQLGISSIK